MRYWILVAAWYCAAWAQVSASSPPNLVVFLVDDLGVMDTSLPFLTDANGAPQAYPLNQLYRTPNMERLAERGIRFNHFYAMSVCSPTRVSLMTGQNAARHRTTNWINPEHNNGGPQGPPQWNWQGLKAADVTLPRLLQASGYRTIHVGKGHFGPHESEGADPRQLGFDVNIAGAAFGAPGSYYASKNFRRGGKSARHAVPDLEKYHGTDTFLTEALTIEAKQQIDLATQSEQPFFLYLSHYAVHAPFDADPRFADHYRQSGQKPPAQAFATLVEGMDQSLGELIEHLESLGVAENTLILFLGDNGSDAPLGHEHAVACAAPLRGKKGSHYEGGVRVPFIAAWAQPNPEQHHQRRLPIAAGAIQSQPANVCDIFPTLLALASVEAPPEHAVDGARLDTLLGGKADPGRRQSFLMHYPHSPHRSNYFTSYHDDGWKVVYHYAPDTDAGESHYQLFHLAEDPFESTDLAGSEPQRLSEMMRALVGSLEQHQALYPVDRDGITPLRPRVP